MPTTGKIAYSESSNGGLLNLIDESTYSDPIGNYARKVQLWSGKDGSGTMLEELDFTGTDLSVSVEKTEDRYYSAVLIFTGSPAIANAISNFTTERIEQNLLNAKLKRNCGGCKLKNCDKTTLGFIYLYQSQVATQYGNSGLANDFIGTSFKYLQD